MDKSKQSDKKHQSLFCLPYSVYCILFLLTAYSSLLTGLYASPM